MQMWSLPSWNAQSTEEGCTHINGHLGRNDPVARALKERNRLQRQTILVWSGRVYTEQSVKIYPVRNQKDEGQSCRNKGKSVLGWEIACGKALRLSVAGMW